MPLLLLAAGLSCANPGQQLDQAQLMLDLSDAVVDLREQNALLQEQIDSLKLVAARQDTVLRRVATLSGVPIGND